MTANAMNERSRPRVLPLLSLALLAGTVLGQEGFPLDGTWRAQLNADRTIVLVMKWDGQRINGMINPGPRSIEFDSATLEPSDWGVRIEATNADGQEIIVDGTLVEIGSYNRRIVGTWTEAGAVSDLDLRRE